MKRTFTILLTALIFSGAHSQTVADFETFTLQPNSYYKDTNNVPFQTTNAVFLYEWTKGMFPYWSNGFSYTNAYDSTNGTFMNLYGVKSYKGYSNSSIYVVGQNQGIIRIPAAKTIVKGFYCTNTTYAYKSIKEGDSFSRKFGDTTGTGSGTTIAQGAYPDYFKLVVRGYKNGTLKADSVEYYLADFRSATPSQDYIVKDWQFVNTATLGVVDSIKFFMRSTVANSFGMLTPGFFGMDNFTTEIENPAGLNSLSLKSSPQAYPNPFSNELRINSPAEITSVRIYDLAGKTVFSAEGEVAGNKIDLGFLDSGIYFMDLKTNLENQTLKIIKE